MIGGTDTVVALQGQSPVEALGRAVRVLAELWPAAVAEDGFGASFDRVDAVPLADCCDLFIYKDDPVRQVWNAFGATPDGEAAMVHLITSDTSITIVTGPLDLEETRLMVEKLSRAVCGGAA